MNNRDLPIPVVDLFAGPGGLSEGFSSVTDAEGRRVFNVCISIEKEPYAHRTLLLRSFYRQFIRRGEEVPEEYFRYIRGEIVREELFSGRYADLAQEAETEAIQLELGEEERETTRNLIRDAKGNTDRWVLIGGPPCQAYSLVGRSRRQGRETEDQKKRHFLYREYLHIIADHWPSVFVMENVKGMLSSEMNGEKIFHRILDDLEDPAAAVTNHVNVRRARGTHRYRIFSLVKHAGMLSDLEPKDTVIKAEDYGIPQARHRVILLGIRDDLEHQLPQPLTTQSKISISQVLSGLPALRSGLSKGDDSPDRWVAALRAMGRRKWFLKLASNGHEQLFSRIMSVMGEMTPPPHDRGSEFISGRIDVGWRRDWFLDKRIGGVCNHTTRAHIKKDLLRYLYAACYAEVKLRSPNIRDFPRELRPKHENVKEALKGSMFADRFRVQLWNQPGTTVTSHISKDGHYFIHPDPEQCRSLTVREAARLQTFPDNYFFEGPRTSQYQQVGNAVPPLLAKQIAERVFDLIK
jgi:DNA (cytosine-5)-methyltransferase 1